MISRIIFTLLLLPFFLIQYSFAQENIEQEIAKLPLQKVPLAGISKPASVQEDWSIVMRNTVKVHSHASDPNAKALKAEANRLKEKALANGTYYQSNGSRSQVDPPTILQGFNGGVHGSFPSHNSSSYSGFPVFHSGNHLLPS